MKIRINPISVNKCWKGRRFKTSEYKAWREMFCLLVNTTDKDLEPTFARLEFGLKAFKTTDLDNLIKPTLDAITEAGVIKDDRFIEQLVTFKKKVKEKDDEYINITLA